ncbi:MAG: DUF3617 family protein [Proteobacteria bacterium]|nr:DUF3617 family protein [Pseudomonadota bacterium]
MSLHKSLPAAALLLLAACSAGAANLDYPPRKPGLWEMSMAHGDEAQAKPHVIQQCIDAKTDASMREMGQGASRDACTKQDMRKEGATIVVDSVCKMGPTTLTSHAEISGDFSSNYRMESHTTYEPPMAGRAKGTAIVEAKWLGPCKAGQKPGDMVMPNGQTMNFMDMQSMQKNRKK